MKQNELTSKPDGRVVNTTASLHTDAHGGVHSESTVTEHDGTIVRTSMHVDEFGWMTLTFHATDLDGNTTVTVFDLVERPQDQTAVVKQ